MRTVDLSSNQRIARYTHMLREASRLTDPAQVQRLFAMLLRDENLVNGFISLSTRGLPPGLYKITRLNITGDMGEVRGNPWQDFHTLPTHTGGFLGKVIETPEPRIFADMNIAADPVLGDGLAPFGSCFANPLYDDGEALNWSITFRHDPAGYSPQEAESFLLRGNVIGRMTKTLVVARQVRELNAQLTAQLEQIAQIQRSLLPDQTPRVPGLAIATSYLTSTHAGGDYYDFFDMGDGRLGVLVADVSGHGAGAATLMAMLQTILHAYQDRHKGPAAMLEHANRVLLTKRVESAFVTAFMGVFSPDRTRFTYANAGHNRPFFRRERGGITPLTDAASLPLGIIEEPRYEEATAPASPGETLVIYTDGITEAFSPPPEREMFGNDRLIDALERCSGEPSCVIESVHERLYEHTRSRDRADDQTIVALRIEP